MARRISRKELKQDEIQQAAVDAGHWIEEHWKQAAIAVAGVAVLVLAILGWQAAARRGQVRVEESLARASATFERADAAGFADAAQAEELLGELDQVIHEAGGSAAGWTARFLRGATLYRTGRLDEAEAALDEVRTADRAPRTLAATAESLLAEVYAAAGREDDALRLLGESLDGDVSLLPTEETLRRMARIHDRAGHPEQARELWQRIVDEFPESPAADEAREQLES